MLVSGSLCEGWLHRKVGGGIDQHLAGEFWAVAVARGQRHHGGEIAAGAVAADQQVRGVDAELFGVGGNPFRGGDGVIGGGGEFVLGREAVIDGDDDQLAFMGELRQTTSWVSRLPITQPPPWKNTRHGARPLFLRSVFGV